MQAQEMCDWHYITARLSPTLVNDVKEWACMALTARRSSCSIYWIQYSLASEDCNEARGGARQGMEGFDHGLTVDAGWCLLGEESCANGILAGGVQKQGRPLPCSAPQAPKPPVRPGKARKALHCWRKAASCGRDYWWQDLGRGGPHCRSLNPAQLTVIIAEDTDQVLVQLIKIREGLLHAAHIK